MTRIFSSAMLCASLLTATSVSANLVVNGSFETPISPAGSFVTYPGGSTAITG